MSAQDDDLDFGVEDETPETVEAEQVNDGDIPGTGEQDGSESGDRNWPVSDPFTNEPESKLTDEEKASDKQAAEQAAKAKADQAAADQKAFDEALANFKATAEATLTHEGRDVSTGELPEVVTQTVREAYAALPGAKGKSAGKAFLQERMQESMLAGTTDTSNYLVARTFMNLFNAMKDTKVASGIVRPKVDPTEAHVDRVAALLLAANLAVPGADVEAGWSERAEKLAADLSDDVRAYRAWLDKTGDDKGEAPKVHPVVLTAAKLATGRATGTGTTRPRAAGSGTPRQSTAGSGHRGDIAAHIAEVFEAHEVGDFLPISAIAKTPTSQYGKDGAPPPSQGAIAARLFPASGQCSLNFVRPEGPDDGRPVKGAVKIEPVEAPAAE